MSLYSHLRSSLGLVQKIALSACVFIMAVALPVIAKADVISTPRVGLATSHASLIAVIVLVAVVGFIMIIRRRR